MQVVRYTELCEGKLATEFYNGGGLKRQRWETFNEMSIWSKTNSLFPAFWQQGLPVMFLLRLAATHTYCSLLWQKFNYVPILLNSLKTKRRLLYLKTQSVPRSKHFYKNQSFYGVRGTSRCWSSDKYKTHNYSAGRAYSCWMLNPLVYHVTTRL
jgi:hypothetical protein